MGGGGGGGSAPIDVFNPSSYFSSDIGSDFSHAADPFDLTGSRTTQAAIGSQTAAINNANQVQANIFNQEQRNAQPYQQAGAAGLSQLQGAMPSLTKNFTMADFQNNPGYQFQMQQGLKAVQQSAAAGGSLGSGGTMKALEQYGQGLAGTQYQQAFQNYQAQNQQNYNMLSGLANYGQAANGQIADAGKNYADQVSSNDIGLGNAQAGAYIGQANRTSGLIGQGAAAGAMMFSDERLKTEIEPVSKTDLENLKAHLKAYRFKYKSEKYGKGDWIGVMAQDLEKSKLGRTLVSVDKDGFKHLDMVKVMSLFLATLAEG